MKRRGWLPVILFALLPVVVVGAAVAYMSAPSVVVITNEGSRPATLSVSMTNAGQFSWDGRIEPGDRVVRIARFSDNSFQIRCRDADGEAAHSGGYVTNGSVQIVNVKIAGCANVVTTVDY